MWSREYIHKLALNGDYKNLMDAVRYDKYTMEELADDCAEELLNKIRAILDDGSLKPALKAYEILMLLSFGRGI